MHVLQSTYTRMQHKSQDRPVIKQLRFQAIHAPQLGVIKVEIFNSTRGQNSWISYCLSIAWWLLESENVTSWRMVLPCRRSLHAMKCNIDSPHVKVYFKCVHFEFWFVHTIIRQALGSSWNSEWLHSVSPSFVLECVSSFSFFLSLPVYKFYSRSRRLLLHDWQRSVDWQSLVAPQTASHRERPE